MWSEQELARFLRHAQHDDLYPLWALLASTGMRRSEALGLPWRDVDFDGKRLSVRRGLVSVDGTPELGPPKSRHAVRTIDLDDRTIAALRIQRRRQNEQRLAAKDWNDTGLVFTRPDGSWLHPDWIGELFRRLVHEAGVPAISHARSEAHARDFCCCAGGITRRSSPSGSVTTRSRSRLTRTRMSFPGCSRRSPTSSGNLLPDVDDEDDDGLGGVPRDRPGVAPCPADRGEVTAGRHPAR